MAQFTTAGYQAIRDWIEANFDQIEVRNELGAAVVRLASSDARVSWVHGAGANPLQLQVVLTGSDADITPPVTLRSSAVYNAGGTELSAETFAEGDAAINADPDSVTITHDLEIPNIP